MGALVTGCHSSSDRTQSQKSLADHKLPQRDRIALNSPTELLAATTRSHRTQFNHWYWLPQAITPLHQNPWLTTSDYSSMLKHSTQQAI